MVALSVDCRRGVVSRRTPTASCGRSSGSTSRSPTHEVARPGRPLGLRQVDPAGADLRPARAERRRRSRSAARATPPGASPAAPTCPSATCCCPGTRRSTTPRWRCATAALGKAEARRRGRRAVRALRPRRLRARAPGRALRRDAPAGRLPAHAGRRQAGAGPRRALRLARRDHPGRDAGVAGRGAARPTRAPSSSSPTTSRRRSTSPTGSPCSRPARRGSSPSCGAPAPRAADRDAAVTDPAFVAVRERAHARPCDEGAAMRRWLLPALLLAALIGAWQLAASSRRARRRARPRRLPRPLARRNRRIALAEPLAARRKRLGDAARDPARLRLRARRRARASPSLMHLSATAARRRLPADRRLADDPDHRHRADPGRLVRLRDRPEAGRSSP